MKVHIELFLDKKFYDADEVLGMMAALDEAKSTIACNWGFRNLPIMCGENVIGEITVDE
jgi:hypothetical protein